MLVRTVIWLVVPVASSLAALLASLGLRSLTTALLNGVGVGLCTCFGAVSVFFLDVAQARGFVLASVAAIMPALGVLLAAWLSARRHPNRLLQFLRGAGGAAAVAALWLMPGILSALYVAVLATPGAYLRPTWWRDSLEHWQVSFSVPPTAQPAAVLLECRLPVLGVTSLALLDPATGRMTWIQRGMPRVPPDRREGCWSPDGSRVVWQHRDVYGLERCLVWLGIERSGSRREDMGPGGWAPDLFAYDLKTRQTTCVPHEAWDGLLGRGLHWWYDATTILWVVVGQPVGPGLISFVNTENGSVHSCLLFPASTTATRKFQTVVLPGRRAFVALWRKASAEAAEELLIATGTPDTAEATLLRVTEPPPRGARFQAVSPDARWGLFVTAGHGDVAGSLHLVDLGTGTTRQVDLPPAAYGLPDGPQPLLPSPSHALPGPPGGFGPLDGWRWAWELALLSFPDADRLAVSCGGVHAVYELSRSTWQVYAPPSPDGPLASGLGWRASPDGTRILQLYRADDRGALMARVFDLNSAEWTVVPLPDGWQRDVQWYGNEHVLTVNEAGVWRIGLDGSRELLWPRE
jgi:hypothetical protein